MNRFWMVWNHNGTAPRYKHTTRIGAGEEAIRLAKLWPGQQFYVLEAVSRVIVNNTEYLDLDGDQTFTDPLSDE